jgi:hypothetical protein
MPISRAQTALRQARVPTVRTSPTTIDGVNLLRVVKGVLVVLDAADTTTEPVFRTLVDSWRAR